MAFLRNIGCKLKKTRILAFLRNIGWKLNIFNWNFDQSKYFPYINGVPKTMIALDIIPQDFKTMFGHFIYFIYSLFIVDV